ncbi:MAG: sulfur oxidation c-type cytochrome SoxX [Lautropia sp.]|nr:MAG: sulfur oxidation c-type cytochrome SoxX [Pseudomonadota bacterium]MBC6958887.1 sulfur oxidation c-type cytochrome SoxX [Lautropia sp.]MCL4701035.1 sulfur oxidation c-type cytochrome SoxX [Burkholderiaceae bacterium]MDL1907902.1 sulfur oxidation c-type cytochrome SoxX [Betaproteobacteria bacterium PRO1]RIK90428.1 MAG: sulfur oxidation c-type cytochrome SoxX [Burkholderiales bacterium]
MKRAIMWSGILAAAIAGGCATTADRAAYDAKATATIQRDFHARGIATMDRLKQDELQLACTRYRDHPPEDVLERLEAQQRATIRLPADGVLSGDWKRGAALAESGRGMSWSDKPGTPSGGSCYNCHELAPQQTSFGTMGPSLRRFGKLRGYTAEVQKYAYERIYNSKAFAPCSAMPRFGTSGTLTEQQIKDLVAYLTDPESPVNK